MRSSDARYNLALILGHWLLALMILISLGLGWYVQYIPQSSEVSNFLINTHTSFGITIAILLVAYQPVA
jgi:cytochrome b561